MNSVSAEPLAKCSVLQWSPTIGAIAKAILAAQGKMGDVLKSEENPAFKSRYADLADVLEAVLPALQAAGVAVLQVPTATYTEGAIVSVETLFLHESGEFFLSRLDLRPTKSDPQGVGSAITYARRYALLSMCAVAPVDDDGNAASGGHTQTPARPQNAPSGQQKPFVATPRPTPPPTSSAIAWSDLEALYERAFPAAKNPLKAWLFEVNIIERGSKNITAEQKQAARELLDEAIQGANDDPPDDGLPPPTPSEKKFTSVAKEIAAKAAKHAAEMRADQADLADYAQGVL